MCFIQTELEVFRNFILKHLQATEMYYFHILQHHWDHHSWKRPWQFKTQTLFRNTAAAWSGVLFLLTEHQLSSHSQEYIVVSLIICLYLNTANRISLVLSGNNSEYDLPNAELFVCICWSPNLCDSCSPDSHFVNGNDNPFIICLHVLWFGFVEFLSGLHKCGTDCWCKINAFNTFALILKMTYTFIAVWVEVHNWHLQTRTNSLL